MPYVQHCLDIPIAPGIFPQALVLVANSYGDMRRGWEMRKLAKAHEVVKRPVKRLALCNPEPGGVAIPPKQLIMEAKHL